MNVARLRLGARCVVFNNRGRGGHVLKTARTYCASKTDDLAAVIDHIKAKNPNASLMALGVSLGKFLCTVKMQKKYFCEIKLFEVRVFSHEWGKFYFNRVMEEELPISKSRKKSYREKYGMI